MVTDANIMLWITDEPLAYQTATGGRMSFKTYYNANYNYFTPPGYLQFGGNYPIDNASFDNNWGASWLSYIDFSYGDFILYPPGGGVRTYANFDGTVLDYYTKTRLIGMTNGGNLTEFNLLYPSGAKDIYGFNYEGGGGWFFLTQQIDAQGRATTYLYRFLDVFNG